jgi:hypothetical protein
VRLSRLRDSTAATHLRSNAPSYCDTCQERIRLEIVPNLLVSEDRWESATHSQRLYHLLCLCGGVLGSTAGERTAHPTH